MDITDRIEFLAKSFDVFENNTHEVLEQKITQLQGDGEKIKVLPIINSGGKTLALISTKVKNKGDIISNISVGMSVFSDMIAADPTKNKVCLQWMLNVFTRLIRENHIDIAIRFVDEDLPQANSYLTLFEANKRKQKFISLCKGTKSLEHVKDPTDINQFKSLTQLFDAVDPFIEREPSAVERTMVKFVNSGAALIPARDRKFTVFIPKTTDANVIFDSFANWCTAKPQNGMFNSYTNNNKKPNGKNSDIYIIIDNKFFSGESEEIYQIHFETKQIKDRRNASNVDFFEKVLSKSEVLSAYFYEELMAMAKGMKTLDKNLYVDYLIDFGFTECLFDLIEKDTKAIKFMKRNIPRIPDISVFKDVDHFIITEANLTELHPSIGGMENLETLVLRDNKLKILPKEIGRLKNLVFMNILGNKLSSIPDEIKYLDKSNGGALEMIVVNSDDIGGDNFIRLKGLLPNTIFS